MKKCLFLLLCCVSFVFSKQPLSLKGRYSKTLDAYKSFKGSNRKSFVFNFFQTDAFKECNQEDVYKKLQYDCSGRTFFAKTASFAAGTGFLSTVVFGGLCARRDGMIDPGPLLGDYELKGLLLFLVTSFGSSVISSAIHGGLLATDKFFPGDITMKKELFEGWKAYKLQQKILGQTDDEVEALFKNEQSTKKDPDIVFVGV